MPTVIAKPNTVSVAKLVPRPPIVVVLGHIDHGKTKLLDAMRKTSVVDMEAGGITQHIGASEIVHNNKRITLVDTPGHEAFSQIRSRGATVADVGILVVAADEGIKPQTQEAIKVLQETKTPFVVAINKIDKPEANPSRVKQQLAEAGVYVEGYGGQVPAQEISATTVQGVNELLDLVLLVAELENLQADPKTTASGIVIESHLDKRRGVVATLIITNGTLKRSDFVSAEEAFGKIRILEDFRGQPLLSAVFSSPVRVIGFEKLPPLGAQFHAFSSKADLENYLELLAQKSTSKKAIPSKPTPKKTEKKTLYLILKADTQGSLEAIEKSLRDLQLKEINFQILDGGVGDVNENDVKLARIQGARSAILAFRVKTLPQITALAEAGQVDIIAAEIIYELLDNLKNKLRDLFVSEERRILTGRLKVLATFKQGSNFQIVGGQVISGVLHKGLNVSILRGDKEISHGLISQLQQNKADVNEVAQGSECGLQIKNISPSAKIEKGDTVEVFEQELIKGELE